MKNRLQVVLCKFLMAGVLAVSVWNPVAAAAQQSAAIAPVPNLVQFGGMLRDQSGKPMAGVVGVTFLLYREQQGGAPLWIETQNLRPDKNGHYSVMLGSTSAYGMPNDIFVAGEARWLAVQVEGQPEQPRVMLLSVPYALKAGDADTLGGLPVSAFMLAAPGTNAAATAASTSNSAAPGGPAPPPPSSNVTTSGGKVNALPLWTTATNIQSSALAQTGTGSTAKIGINTTTPSATLDVKGTATVEGLLTSPATGTSTSTSGKNSQPQQLIASSFNSTINTPVSQTFQWQAESANNNTSSPAGTLNLLFGQGSSKPAETGLHIAGDGQIAFASGQTFPGTISNITAGQGLAESGSGGNLTLGVANSAVTNAMLQNSAIGVSPGAGLVGGGTVPLGGSTSLGVDPTRVPFLNASNTFNASQNINGDLTILNNADFQPLAVQSSSTFGTWLNLINTSTGGRQWTILSAGGANGEGAGNLGITNFTGTSNIFLEGAVHANTLSVNNDTPMSSNPHLVFSAFMVGNLGSSPIGGFFIPDKNITITRVTASEASTGNGCSADSFAVLFDTVAFNGIFSLDLGQNIALVDSGPLSIPVSAGTQLEIFGTASSGCGVFGSSPSNVFLNVQYVMQ